MRYGSALLVVTLVGMVSGRALAQEKPVLYVGESAAEVYRHYHDAKRFIDTATVLACTSRRTGATEESVYESLMQGRSTLPLEIDILEEEDRETIASLLVSGRRINRETGKLVFSKGTVTLVKEDGTWRIRHEAWTDTREEDMPKRDALRASPS